MIPDFCLLLYFYHKIKDDYIYNHKCNQDWSSFNISNDLKKYIYILNNHKILALPGPVARELTNIVQLYLTINSDFLQLR